MIEIGTKKLETERLILRKITKKDALELYQGLANQPEFLYYTNKKPITLQDEINSLENINEKYKNKSYYNWLITLKDSGKIIGAVNFNVNERNDSVMFNYAIDNRFTNNGYMTEALLCVKKFAFSQIKVHRFEGGCVVENISSKRVMEKCGLTQEGVLKDYVKLADGYHDMIMFAEISQKNSIKKHWTN